MGSADRYPRPSSLQAVETRRAMPKVEPPQHQSPDPNPADQRVRSRSPRRDSRPEHSSPIPIYVTPPSPCPCGENRPSLISWARGSLHKECCIQDRVRPDAKLSDEYAAKLKAAREHLRNVYLITDDPSDDSGEHGPHDEGAVQEMLSELEATMDAKTE